MGGGGRGRLGTRFIKTESGIAKVEIYSPTLPTMAKAVMAWQATG